MIWLIIFKCLAGLAAHCIGIKLLIMWREKGELLLLGLAVGFFMINGRIAGDIYRFIVQGGAL